MAETLKFGYWQFRGLGQPIRFLLEYLGLPYEEKHYTLEKANEWFEGDKKSLGLFLPNLPYLIDGAFNLTESAAIQAYVIRRAGRADLLGGADLHRSARIYQAASVLRDVSTAVMEVLKTDEYKTQFKEKIERHVENISKQLGTKDWLLGEITLADFLAYEILCYISGAFTEDFQKYENLVHFKQRFEELPKIKEYMASPRFIKAPFVPGHIFKWTGI